MSTAHGPVNHAAVRATGKCQSPRFPPRNGEAAVTQGRALQEPALPRAGFLAPLTRFGLSLGGLSWKTDELSTLVPGKGRSVLTGGGADPVQQGTRGAGGDPESVSWDSHQGQEEAEKHKDRGPGSLTSPSRRTAASQTAGPAVPSQGVPGGPWGSTAPAQCEAPPGSTRHIHRLQMPSHRAGVSPGEGVSPGGGQSGWGQSGWGQSMWGSAWVGQSQTQDWKSPDGGVRLWVGGWEI